MHDVAFDLELETESVMRANPGAPVCVPTDATLTEVFERLKQDAAGSVLVCRGETLVGIFTERDALRLMAHGADLSGPIEQVMVRDPVTVTPQDSVATAIEKMSAGGYRRLPIVAEGNKPVGVIRAAGILHFMVTHFPQVIYTLPPQPHHRAQEREGA
jgi:CBS domain-containing protein